MPSYQANKLSNIEQNMEFFAQLFSPKSILFLSGLPPHPCRRQNMSLNRHAPLPQRPQQHAKTAGNPYGSTRHDVFGEMNAAYHAHGGYECIGHEQHAPSQGAPGKPAHGNNRRREHMAARKRPADVSFLIKGSMESSSYGRGALNRARNALKQTKPTAGMQRQATNARYA